MKFAIKLLSLLLCAATVAVTAGCVKKQYYIDGEKVDEDYYYDYIESKKAKRNNDDEQGNEETDKLDDDDDGELDDNDNDDDEDDDDEKSESKLKPKTKSEKQEKTENREKSENNEKNKLKRRLTQDGVDYLVNNGVLIISGNGTVTKDAISKLLPYYNTVDFEIGSFDVGDDAFNGYGDNITEIRLRNNVSVIGERAFKGCNIAFILLGSSITQIGDDAFEDCNCLEDVFINNEYIFKNFNSRYDFGGVGATAEHIWIYKTLVPLIDQDKFLEYNSIAGDYLTVNGFFDELDKSVNHSGYTGTAAGANYAYSFFFYEDSCYFGNVSKTRYVLSPIKNYNPETNTADSKVSESFWEEKGVEITFYYGDEEASEKNEESSENGSSSKGGFIGRLFNKKSDEKATETDNSNKADKSSESKTNSSKSTSNFIDNRTTSTADRSKNCRICNGSGRKTCTSCSGGYYTEYETGTYMGYGSPTRAVKKRCPVCHGTGYVTCYH